MPIYNEARWIDTVLERVLARKEVGQVVAVDDGSTDGSWEKLQASPAKDPRVVVISHKRNRGKGAAIRTALTRLETPLILIQDADLEYDPADYPKLLAPVLNGTAEVVYGSRFTASGSHNPRWHTLGNRLLTWAANRVTGLRLTDEARVT
ncbi:MAG: glycosyltransferase family 2 protein, partial [Rhodospirillales bacterium]|nr:glycosyltransferase family 2 protein [Rhodospirillales bacterium]